jgi:orotate phosphoribosyltransferase
MTGEEVIEIFKKSGSFLEGHFVLTSGDHSPHYFQKSKVFQFPEYNTAFSAAIIDAFKDKTIDKVVAPATGAIVLGTEVGRQLGVPNIYAERENGVMSVRRGFEINEGENILIVEDIVTTGGSVKEVVEMVEKLKGNIVGIGLIIDRSNGKVDFGYPTKALATVDVVKFKPDEVPDWLKEIPITTPGSRYL